MRTGYERMSALEGLVLLTWRIASQNRGRVLARRFFFMSRNASGESLDYVALGQLFRLLVVGSDRATAVVGIL